MEENYIVLNKWDIEALMDANPKSGFTYYKIRKANSRQITEYY